MAAEILRRILDEDERALTAWEGYQERSAG
jgi:hypothetical protein